MNYIIVLFKNKRKKKIINKFISKERAIKFYTELLKKNNDVIFEKKTENGVKCYFELALMEKKNSKSESIYIKDELGRSIKVVSDSEDFDIFRVNSYKIEEEFWDYSTKKKLTCPSFIKKYLNKNGVKMISKINNKIILQIDEIYKMFTMKDCDDANRFIDSLEKEFIRIGKKDCIMIKDYSFPQKKYLYDILIEQGFPKSYLQRYSTTHLSKR